MMCGTIKFLDTVINKNMLLVNFKEALAQRQADENSRKSPMQTYVL